MRLEYIAQITTLSVLDWQFYDRIAGKFIVTEIKMNWKQLLAIAAIIMAGGFFVRSFQPAHAQQMPHVNYASNPYKSFYGQIQNGASTTLLTAPSDQPFMVTTLITNRNNYSSGLPSYHHCKLMIDGTLAMGGDIADRQNNHAFNMGNAHLVISAGSVLSIQGYGSTCHYYVEGYYIHP